MAYQEPEQFMVEDARIMFRNFEGKEDQYTRAGDRSFCVILTPEAATNLLERGFNVKETTPREEGDEPVPYIKVAVGYKVRPPLVVMMTSRARTRLDEESISILDWADIEKVDLIATAYDWTANGNSGRKAYLKSLFVTVLEDELERKYAINDPGDES